MKAKNLRIIIVATGVLLLLGLLSLDLKAPLTSSSRENKTEVKEKTFEELNFEAKKSLNADQLRLIEDQERSLKNADENKQIAISRSIASNWADFRNTGMAAKYYLQASEISKSEEDLINAGLNFRKTAANEVDSVKKGLIFNKAMECLEKAVSLQPQNLNAQAYLGALYVDGTSEPMKGIMMLRGVVEKDPENIVANLNLGIFSIRSNQFDKAIQRLELVNRIQPDLNSLVYLAEAYEKSGNKKEAIKTLEKAKNFSIDEDVRKGLTEYIKSLNN